MECQGACRKVTKNKTSVAPKEIIKLLKESHPLLTDREYWFGGRERALQMMYLESSIVDKVLEKYVSMNKIVLPMFDGFITVNKGNNQSELKDIMEWAFKEVMGNQYSCQVDIEY